MARVSRPSSAAVFALLLTIVCTGTARGDRPTFTDVDFTTTDAALSQECGFPVQVHFQGKLIDTQVGGTFLTRGAGFTVTFTNLTTGTSFLYQVSGLQRFQRRSTATSIR